MIIDGKKISQDILSKLKEDVSRLPIRPMFCDVLVGEDPASAQYVKMKGRLAETIGIEFRRADFPSSIPTAELVAEIKKLNNLPRMAGLIVQLPLPASLGRAEVLNAIDPSLDVDCTGEVNTRLFYEGQGSLLFPTAAAVMAILDSLDLDITNKSIVVVGQGELVGRPVAFLLRQRGLRMTVADKFTSNIPQLLKEADVIVSATGKGKLITGEGIKKGSVVIDAGTSESNGGIIGDVDFETVSQTAGFLSPVPGGVGPVTVAKLLGNVVQVAREKFKNPIL